MKKCTKKKICLSQFKKKTLYKAGHSLHRRHCFSSLAKNICSGGQPTLKCSAAPGSRSHSWNASSVLFCACWGPKNKSFNFFKKKLATLIFSSGQELPFPLQHTHASQSRRRQAKDFFVFHSSAWRHTGTFFFIWFYSTEETGRTAVYTL